MEIVKLKLNLISFEDGVRVELFNDLHDIAAIESKSKDEAIDSLPEYLKQFWK